MFEFAKSAISGALGGKGPSLPFTIGEPVGGNSQSIWTLHKGVKKDDQSAVTVFIFDVARNRDKLPLARNALRRSRTIRHPDLPKFIDGIETETQIIIGTEELAPLSPQLQNSPNPFLISWGLYKIAHALKFLSVDCSMIHGNVQVGSIYTTKAGEWKLGSFELVSSLKEDNPVILSYGGLLPNTGKYAPPEVRSGSWSSIRSHPTTAVDSWAFGCLIHEIFNGAFSRPEDLGARGNIPQELKIYKPLMNPNPKGRMDLNTFLQQNFGPGGYFENDFVSVNLFLEQIAIKDSHEKDQFLRKIDTALDTFPIEFSKYKILPELIKALEFGGAGAKALNPILKLGSKLTQEEFDLLIVPIIVKLFASPDRSIRISLCENMGHFITHLSNKTVTEKIFPNLATGFHDISAVIREQTLKSVSLIIPKLSEKIINNDLLRFLAKLQQDEEPGIRTNTTICLGKISKNLNEATRKRVLIPAFLRSLVDPFPPSRNAGLLAISATADYYDPPDIAQKLIPSISPLTLDGEKMIRTQAFKNIESLLKKLETAAAALPDTAIPPPAAAAPRVPGSMPTPPPQSQSSNSEGWAGWAISAVSDKVTNSLMNAAIGGTIGVTGVTPPPRTPVSPPVADAGLKDMSSRSGTSIVTATSVAGGTGTTAGGWDTMNNEGWDEEIPFDDSLWGNAQKETPKAKPILPTKKASSSHGFGQITTTSDATMPRLAGPPKSVASDAPIPRLPPPPGGAAPKPAVNNSGWDDDDWGLGSTTTNTAASILPRKSLSTTSPSPVAAFGTGGGAGGGGGWDDWAGGGNDGWDSVGGAQKVSPMNRPISPTGSLSSLDSRGADREAEKERRRQKMAELREARKASKLGAKKI